MTAATTTEAAPYSEAEMREALAVGVVMHNRAIATAAALERATKWVADWVPGTDGAAYNSGRAEGRADLCAALRAVLDPADTHHWNQDGLLGEARRLVSLAKAPVATADPVERPAHYTQGDIECIDAIKAQLSPDEYRGFLRGQVAKYLWRLGRKGSALEDAQKAQWYLERLVCELGGGK